MRYNREKESNINKVKITISILIIIVIICGIILIITQSKETKTSNNNETNILSDINTVYDNGEITESAIMAYIKETDTNKKLENGDRLNNNISVYCNKGSIVEITHNGNIIEEADLNEDGEYIITMKPNNQNENVSIAITINKTKSAVVINGDDIVMGETYNINSIITIKEKNEIDRIAKALLIKCNTNYEQDNTTDPIDITRDLKNEGYTIDKIGIYKIQFLDENNNDMEFVGSNRCFKVR